jgi:hypothetical protein
MRTSIFSLLVAMLTGISAYPQEGALQHPTKEEFVNAVFRTVVDSSYSSYYLIRQSDTCRFVKFNYEDWAQYTLKEPVSIVILNELAEKVYHSKGPYFWRKDELQKAICISNKEADSILFQGSQVQKDRPPAKNQLENATVFSFSQPQFTDDGRYAVIDLNFVCGRACGKGFTCLFRLTATGWKLIAKYNNWSA